MVSQFNTLWNALEAGAKCLNPDILTAYAPATTLTVWSEGGEWPAYCQEYENWELHPVVRNFDNYAYEAFPNLQAAVRGLKTTLQNDNFAALALDCGVGKSTKLAREVHSLKYGKRTFVVQPSMVCARQLADYLNKDDVYHARAAAEVTESRGITYLSAGAMLDVVLRGAVLPTDVIMVDEAHSVTFVHVVLRDLLSRIQNVIVFMTASTSSEYKTLRGVKLKECEGSSPELSDALAAEPNHLVVGVMDNMSYATSANALIGLTLPDLKIVYDTGLRPEPVVSKGQIANGERVATKGEVTQMLGRLGRTGKSGVAFKCKNPRAMDVEGIPLYDIMLRAFKNTLGLSNDLDKAKARKAWKESGVLRSPSVSSSQSGAAPREVLHSRAASFTEPPGEQEPMPRVSTSTAVTSDSEDSRPPSAVTRYSYRRKSSGASSSSVVMKSSTRDMVTGKVTAMMQPDPGWRPFARHKPVDESGYQGGGSVSWMLAKLGDTVHRGDRVYPSKFVRADASVISALVKAEVRLVLAGFMLPSYSETEALAVVVLWNDLVDSLGGSSMPLKQVTQFTDYFKGFRNFESAKYFDG